MNRITVVTVALGALSSFAETPWLTAHGRLLSHEPVAAFAGTRSAGAGYSNDELSLEAAWFYVDRIAEIRGARAWQLRAGAASVSVSVGGSAYLVPDQFDLGVGPQTALTLGLGGERVQVDLGVQTSAEAFGRGAVRLPQRALLGVTIQVWRMSWSLQARLGVDLDPRGGAAPWRGEAVLSFAWQTHVPATLEL